MHAIASLLVAATAVNAHYTLPSINYNGANTTAWSAVRQAANWQSNGPVTNVTADGIRCNQLYSDTTGAPIIQPVTAGTDVVVTVNPNAYHPGPLQAYLAKVPAGYTAANWDGSGAVWFRIRADQPTFGSSLTWPSMDVSAFPITIPSCIEDGDYLMRTEHIALHTASSVGGAQFYLSCAQLTVTGGGSTVPTDLVAFPGAYSATDPGILINLYYPIPTSYTNPGPATFTC